jgi:pyruvate,water dikinase
LTHGQLLELAALGRRIEAHFGCPQDIEWAIAGGRFYLLQSRPVTTLEKDGNEREESERCRREEIERVRALADPRGTVWSSYNISEVLPEPCPMTWALASELMSGRGGLGLAYRDLGFIATREIETKGLLDLICGRPYVNLRREPQMYLAEFPYEHDFAQLKANPSLASYPTPRVNVGAATGRFWLRLPYLVTRMAVSQVRLARARKEIARRLNDDIFPRFEQWATTERKEPFGGLSDDAVVERFRDYHRRVMVDFVREALKATIVAGLAYANLKGMFDQHLGGEAAHYLAALASGERADVTVEMDEAIWRVGAGEKRLDEFLEKFGHRSVGEFELARPRWREDPAQVERLAHFSVRRGEQSPAELYQSRSQRHQQTMENLRARLKALSGAVRDRIEREMATLSRFMPFRESVKHYWMMGYELLRLCLLELDQRYQLHGGVFHLTPDELPQLVGQVGNLSKAAAHESERRQVDNLSSLIEERKRWREQLLRIPVPQVLFSDDLEAIGRPHEPAAGDVLAGVGVSEGVATGIARVLLEPTDLGEQESGYVLVCPSTDPGWTPLFARARALVMERGGVLSHGAIVAREYGLPAVVNVPDATLRIKVGQHVRVDGDQGKVWLL